MLALLLLPELWLICNQEEAELPILQLSLHSIVIDWVPPSGAKEISLEETVSMGTIGSVLLQATEAMIKTRTTKILKDFPIFILIQIIDVQYF